MNKYLRSRTFISWSATGQFQSSWRLSLPKPSSACRYVRGSAWGGRGQLVAEFIFNGWGEYNFVSNSKTMHLNTDLLFLSDKVWKILSNVQILGLPDWWLSLTGTVIALSILDPIIPIICTRMPRLMEITHIVFLVTEVPYIIWVLGLRKGNMAPWEDFLP